MALSPPQGITCHLCTASGLIGALALVGRFGSELAAIVDLMDVSSISCIGCNIEDCLKGFWRRRILIVTGIDWRGRRREKRYFTWC